ncbi:TPA: replicative DNA helicase [Candidatus Galligastranaerophilus intestinavium]|uniref:Replicative DNA helicase n=1 Tax=Candidatus Galligastranaerophilus intestinavium TaxID=2840836 RepID=A0A9D1FJT1_9BACT|nr:replicative DNA helicase [Candidatus Galligastranaerophilus intestinavium]
MSPTAQDRQKRVPPHNMEAEKAVLGSILINPVSMNRVVDILGPDFFYAPSNRLIYEAMFNLYNQNKPLDAISISDYFLSKNQMQDIGGSEYLSDLMSDTILSSNIEYYANIIKENALKRKLITAGSSIIEETFRNPEAQESLEFAEKMIFDISQQKTSQDIEPLTNVLLETVEKIEYRCNNKGSYTGVPSGYHDLDNMTAGFQNSDFIILAARPSMGKTAFALNIAQNIAIRQNVPVIIFSLEMSKVQLAQRVVCAEAEIDAQRVRMGDLQINEWEKMGAKLNDLHAAPLYIDDTAGVSVSDIRAKCRRFKMKNPNLGLILIDYLQLIEDRSSNDRNQQISSISRGLKSLARELDVPIIALSQLSRKVEDRTDKRPMLSDLRESGAIEQDADVVMFIFREEYYDKENPELKNKAQIIIAKQRNGPTGSFELIFQGSTTKFKNKVNPNLS